MQPLQTKNHATYQQNTTSRTQITQPPEKSCNLQIVKKKPKNSNCGKTQKHSGNSDNSNRDSIESIDSVII